MRTDRRGSAFMEFFFAMPFLLFIMIIGLNFSKTYLMQQRAMVAARYVAWGNLQHEPAPSDDQISRMFFRGEPAQISTSVMGLNQDQQAQLPDTGAVGKFLNEFSGTQRFRVSHHYRPMYAAASYSGHRVAPSWYPDLQISGTIVMDSEDWRYPEMTVMKFVTGLIKQLFGFLK
jgi:hypothetical protein